MKKFLFIFFFAIGSFSAWAENNQEKKDNSDSDSKNCEKVCIKWEEKRDCRPNPIFPEKQICAVYKVCTQYEEKCK